MRTNYVKVKIDKPNRIANLGYVKKEMINHIKSKCSKLAQKE